jgi:hypothetical protein
MDEAFDSIIKTRTTIDKVKIYFGKNEQTNTNMLNCNITKENVDKCFSQFIGYSNTKREFKHIVALDKELITNKNETICRRLLVTDCTITTIPDTNNMICIITEKVETLSEIDFPCSKEYQKNTNCMEYIFILHAKVKLVIHIENNTHTALLDIIVDDYLDTTIQYLKSGVISQISSLLFS